MATVPNQMRDDMNATCKQLRNGLHHSAAARRNADPTADKAGVWQSMRLDLQRR
jgi:hypothetical protein